MNAIEAIKRDIERALEGVYTKLTKPRKDTGHWWLDATYQGFAVTVEWRQREGFGISTVDMDDGYGEGPDEVIVDREAATKRVIALLESGRRAERPPDVMLRELRMTVGITQEQLAARLGVLQAAISKLERRSDMTLGSLRRYVEALGGELEISVRMADGGRVKLLEAKKATGAR